MRCWRADDLGFRLPIAKIPLLSKWQTKETTVLLDSWSREVNLVWSFHIWCPYSWFWVGFASETTHVFSWQKCKRTKTLALTLCSQISNGHDWRNNFLGLEKSLYLFPELFVNAHWLVYIKLKLKNVKIVTNKQTSGQCLGNLWCSSFRVLTN